MIKFSRPKIMYDFVSNILFSLVTFLIKNNLRINYEFKIFIFDNVFNDKLIILFYSFKELSKVILVKLTNFSNVGDDTRFSVLSWPRIKSLMHNLNELKNERNSYVKIIEIPQQFLTSIPLSASIPLQSI